MFVSYYRNWDGIGTAFFADSVEQVTVTRYCAWLWQMQDLASHISWNYG